MVKDEFECVGDVRGKGLMIGIEFVESKASRKPKSAVFVNELLERCRQLGVLYGKGGINGNMFRVKPPMCLTKENAMEAVEALRTALKEKC